MERRLFFVAGFVLCACLVLFVRVAAPQDASLENGVPFNTSLPGLTYANAYIDVPANATSITITLSQGSGDLDLYVKYGDPVNGSTVSELSANADFRSEGAGADESITVTPGSSPPLRGGKWYAATLNLNNTTTHFTLTANYVVTAVAPNISTNVTSLDFGSVAIGDTSEKTVVVSNIGNAALSISSVDVTGGSAGDFSRAWNCPSVAAGGTCTIKVTFRPTSAGGKTAGLNITSNDPDAPAMAVSLSGTGIEPGGGGGGISGSGAARLSFSVNDPFLVPWGNAVLAYRIESFKTGTLADLYLAFLLEDGTAFFLGATPTNPVAPFVSGFPLADAEVPIFEGTLPEVLLPSFVLYGALVKAGEDLFNLDNWLSGLASISFTASNISGAQWEILGEHGNPQSVRVEFQRDKSLRVESWVYPGFQTYKFYNGSLQRSPEGPVAASVPGSLEPPVHFDPVLFSPTTTPGDIRKKLGDPEHVFPGATPDTRIWVFDKAGVSVTIKDNLIRTIEVY